jgi:hypothetical protein
MDENKRQELKRIGFVVVKCCGRCSAGQFPHNEWGTCRIHVYQHLKHTGEHRNLSIHKFGYCQDFHNSSWPSELGAFEEFTEEQQKFLEEEKVREVVDS